VTKGNCRRVWDFAHERSIGYGLGRPSELSVTSGADSSLSASPVLNPSRYSVLATLIAYVLSMTVLACSTV
jgi:hypothetical protein